LSIAEAGVDMTAILQSNLESTIPTIKINIHNDSAVDERWGSLKKNTFSFIWLTTIESELSISSFFGWDSFDVLNVFQLRGRREKGEVRRERGRERQRERQSGREAERAIENTGQRQSKKERGRERQRRTEIDRERECE
jgi:hypothetical protein